MPQYRQRWAAQLSQWGKIILALLLIILLGFVDHWAGPELSFSLFYLGPVVLASWSVGRIAGTCIALVAALTWYVADVFDGHVYTYAWIPVWNSLVRLGFFLIVVFLLGILKNKLELERSLADSDPLTTLANRRSFYERVELEASRAKRYSHTFTIAYIDLDNFKGINDTRGHDVGDQVLFEVAKTIKNDVRHSDLAARLGGDEFAVIFPYVDHIAIHTVLAKLQAKLLHAMQDKDWPITFSIGVITFERPMESTRDMIKATDDLMYKVKKTGKDSIYYETWRG
jgi:diguanylate cyclase (GGDEF)-like protein